MVKFLIVIGTRPEAIKMAPIIQLLEACDEFDLRVCLTGQHGYLLEQVVSFFNLPVHYNLEVMKKNQSLQDITSAVLGNLKIILENETPDMVLVHGDTTTTFAASLAAFYAQIPVGHVEAGLRSGNIYSPFPEEMNRILTSKLASIHFAPTEENKTNLIGEGIHPNSVFVTGNTVIDALLKTKIWIQKNSPTKFGNALQHAAPLLRDAKYHRRILVTGHRRENFGEGFENICSALAEIAKKHPSWLIVYPVHLNPHVLNPVMSRLTGIENICIIEPIEYAPFVYLMDICDLVITDSGGVQEEASSLGKPVIVMRTTTERKETIQSGGMVLVGTNREHIINETQEILLNKDRYASMAQRSRAYGDGNAANKIVNTLRVIMKKNLHQKGIFLAQEEIG